MLLLFCRGLPDARCVAFFELQSMTRMTTSRILVWPEQQLFTHNHELAVSSTRKYGLDHIDSFQTVLALILSSFVAE